MALTKRNLLLAIACGLIALLAFAACGGGDDDDDGSGGDGRNTATATRTDGSGDDGGDDTETPTDDGGDKETPTEDSGDNGGSDSGDVPEDLCGLLSDDEVEAVLGGPPGEPELSNNDPFFSCTWSDEDFNTLSVDLFADSDESNEYWFEITSDAEEIDGLGDRAQYSDLIGLEVLTDHYVVTISLLNFELEDAEVKDLVLSLAEPVLDRIDD